MDGERRRFAFEGQAMTSSNQTSPREPDSLARERAQTVFDRPLVLEAGAGTGKTSTLVWIAMVPEVAAATQRLLL